MTNYEKEKLFELINTKKTCRRSFKMARDEKMVKSYDEQIIGLYSVLTLFNLWHEYFDYSYERNEK